jgi:hypothetical protein
METLKKFENFDHDSQYNDKQFRLQYKKGNGSQVILPQKHFLDTWDLKKLSYDEVSLMDFLLESNIGDFWEDATNKIICVG